MMIIEALKALFLGIIQGITEWLPISSTGHLILADQFIKLGSGIVTSENFNSVFDVVIQFGSILAVVTLYFKKLNPWHKGKSEEDRNDTFRLWAKVIAGVIPAGVIGFLLDDYFDKLFTSPKLIVPTIAATLIIYGVLFIIMENITKKMNIKRMENIGDMKYSTAFYIGLFQTLALIPGTSRSGSTILGGVLLGASRELAAEFSFFMAVPVMLGASALKLIKNGAAFSVDEWILLITGTVVSYIVSIFAIKFLMGYIKKHDFKAFGYYRIVLGVIVIAYFALTHSVPAV
ncbi:MAG: undecaprenyl-diphosphate phosphatase [Oscillospiraceae bacterium]|nr:undecaprenyl-diphosphate phosphatase [Oscillospiraceae bacterium]